MLLSSCMRLGLFVLLAQIPRGPMITSPVGIGQSGDAGDGGPAVQALLSGPFDVDFDPAGNLYVSDTGNHRIRRYDIRTRIITTVAGNGTAGYAGDEGPAIQASLNEPYGLVIDRLGNLFFADRLNRRVRLVDGKTGVITTVAGNGVRAASGDGGPAPEAGLVEPNGVAIDAQGRLYIADVGDNRVRVVDVASGRIETFAGTGRRAHDGDGGPARAASIAGARAVALAPDGTVYILEREGNTLRAVAPDTGIITTVAGTGKAGYSGDGGPARAATLNGPKELAVSAAGDVFIADTENHVIRRIDAKTGAIATVAGNGTRGGSGDGGPATAAQLDRPHGIGIGSDFSIYIGDTGNHRIRRVAP